MQGMSEDLLVRMGDRIQKLRKRRGWTQVVMAEKIGLDRSFIADVERGKRNISILNLDIIAKGFKLSLSRLLSKL
jgi:transcriptional regulator with XRE-family HTH domain